MKTFKVLFVPGLLVMSLALLAQEPQGRGGQGAPAGAATATGGQAIPDAPGGAAAGGRGGRGGGGGGGGNRGGGGGAAAGGGGGGGGGNRGGGGGKNVQVLTAANPIPETMQSFVLALGLLEKGTCTYCHVEDKSSDEKRPKQVARRMITMVRAINGTFPDGKEPVNCYTCHRGSKTTLTETPLSTAFLYDLRYRQPLV